MNKLFMKLLLFQVVALCIACPVLGQTGQEVQQVTTEELQKLREELQNMLAQQDIKLKELEELIAEIRARLGQQEQEDELQALLASAEQLGAQEKEVEEGVGKRFTTGLRQLAVFNPGISLTGDFYGGVSTSKHDIITTGVDEVSDANNNFYMREIELSVQAPLDPFTRGKTFFVFAEDEIELEEGYMDWLNLPLRSNLKVGFFRPEFGLLNRYHSHAFPQFDRPRVMANFFGSEGLRGFGLEADFLLPSIFAQAQNIAFSVIKSGSGLTFTDTGKYNLVYTGYLKNYYDITDETYIEWIVSGAAGKNDADEDLNSYVGGLGITIKWVPASRALYRTVDWKSEFFIGKRETFGDDINSFGFYSSIQNKLNRRFVLGARIGYSEFPSDKNQTEKDFRINLNFWQSEYVLVRFQYSYTERNMMVDNLVLPNDSSFLVHFVWAMGPHKHAAY